MDSSSSINCGYSSMSSSNTSVSNKTRGICIGQGPTPQVGSATFLVSLCEEVEECTYVGDEELVHQFLDPKGLQLSHALEISKRSLRHGFPFLAIHSSHTPFPAQYSGYDLEEKVPSFSTESHEEDEEEDEYFSTVEERRKKERAKKREAAQRVSDGEFLRNPIERSKSFFFEEKNLL
ncbi:unnamed protein product [Lepeophtheirus salmonis]|uniref:(salmon louse) hypothetical protein n=1 Tax=Lepeophtheirus salmonis TaxID=72036 RepID=A0A7R8D4W3_LEPSM|nr:unnamed protein product [Lepeophtheirus salmonis]CAF2998459.1 unnamed protein product [Lepeophtheirus salmonis]